MDRARQVEKKGASTTLFFFPPPLFWVLGIDILGRNLIMTVRFAFAWAKNTGWQGFFFLRALDGMDGSLGVNRGIRSFMFMYFGVFFSLFCEIWTYREKSVVYTTNNSSFVKMLIYSQNSLGMGIPTLQGEGGYSFLIGNPSHMP